MQIADIETRKGKAHSLLCMSLAYTSEAHTQRLVFQLKGASPTYKETARAVATIQQTIATSMEVRRLTLCMEIDVGL
jgi:hypothetical protein